MKTERQLIKKIAEYDSIIIYGAGMVGELLAKRLLSHGMTEKIVGFAVSKKAANTDNLLCGLPVYEIDRLNSYRNSALVIVATMPDLHGEIGKKLADLLFQNIIFVGQKLYVNLARHYMNDFNRLNPAVFSTDSETKVLFMASDNNITSGAFLSMTELCELLDKNGIAALIVLPCYGTGEKLLQQKKLSYTFIPSKDWGYKISENHNRWKKLKFLIGLSSNHTALKELTRLMQKQSVSLVHCNTSYTYIGALAAKHCGIPFVWHIREYMEGSHGYRMFGGKKALALIQESAQVIAVSDYIKGLLGFPNPELVKVIYDPVEREGKPVSKRNIMRQETVQMIMVGAIAPFKGQKELIEACRILKEKNIHHFFLNIVGKGERAYIASLQEYISEHHLEDNIMFYGTSDNVYELYDQSDISFSCCACEAYGRVTVEAMLSGCLVIGIDTGATPELIRDGENGLLYEAGNARSLAACIMQTISQPESAGKLAAAGQSFATETFTKEKYLQQILEIYKKKLQEKADKGKNYA